jgi:hypothetical protein
VAEHLIVAQDTRVRFPVSPEVLRLDFAFSKNLIAVPMCPSGSTEEHLTTDQGVAGSNPVSDVFKVM